MALSLSMKVNTSITQLDLDNVPKKKMEDSNTLDQYLALVAEIREYCARNEVAAREEEDTVEEGPATGTPGRGRMMGNTSRKISLTCETLLRSTAVPQQPVVPDNGLLMEPRRGSGGRLRSPAPSPIPSPVSSPIPSPSRTRFQVSRVADSSFFVNSGQSGSPSSSSSSPVTPPLLSSSPSCFFPSTTNSRFRVTLVESSAPLPIVTSPSGNITVGFTYKKDGDDSTSEAESEVSSTSSAEVPSTSTAEVQVVNSRNAETASGNAVSSSTVASQTVSLVTEQAPLSQNVKVTVKLDPSSDSLIIENESSPSVASDSSEDTVDMEVRTIMNPYSTEDSSLVSCDVQGESRKVPVGPDKDVPTWFSFPDVSNKDVFVVQLDTDKNTCVTEQSAEDCAEQHSVISTVKLDRQVTNSLESLKSVEVVDNGLRTVKPDRGDDDSWNNVKLDEWVDNDMSTKKQGEQIDSSSSIMKPDEQMNRSSEHVIQSLDSNLMQAGQIENKVKQMPPHRTRKIAWVAPSEPVELKAPSNLERLLGLFHSPGSFFNKTLQQQTAVAATVNPQPVANSNTFVLSAGPVGSIFGGGSAVLTSGSESSPECVGETTIKEVMSSVNSSPGVLRKERRTSDCKTIPDVIENNNRVQQVTVQGDSDENMSSGQFVEESKRDTRLCEDENHVSKPYESMSECSEGGCPKSMFEAVTGGNADVETVAGVGGVCDSSDINSRSSQSSDSLEKVDIGTHLESLELADSSDVLVSMSQCTAKGSGTELSMESSAIKHFPTNGTNFKPVPCWKRDSDQFSDDFSNGSPVTSGLPNDKLWSRSCDSSLVSVQNAAATMRLVGGASGFSSCEMDIQRGTGASSVLVSDQNADASLQPAGKEVEMVQAIELHPSNTL